MPVTEPCSLATGQTLVIEASKRLYGHSSLVTINGVEYIVIEVWERNHSVRHVLENYHDWQEKVRWGLR